MTGQFGWRCDKDIIKEATMEKVSVEKVGGIGNESKTRSKYLRRPTMKLNLSTESLARASAQHRWITIGAWLTVLVAAVVLTGALLGDTLTTEDGPTNNPESIRANSLLGERLGESNDTINEMVIVQSTKLTVDDPAYQSYVEDLYGDLTALGEDVIAGGMHYYLTGDESLVSADRRTTLMPLTLRRTYRPVRALGSPWRWWSWRWSSGPSPPPSSPLRWR